MQRYREASGSGFDAPAARRTGFANPHRLGDNFRLGARRPEE